MNYAAQAFNIVQNFFLVQTEEDLDLPVRRVLTDEQYDEITRMFGQTSRDQLEGIFSTIVAKDGRGEYETLVDHLGRWWPKVKTETEKAVDFQVLQQAITAAMPMMSSEDYGALLKEKHLSPEVIARYVSRPVVGADGSLDALVKNPDALVDPEQFFKGIEERFPDFDITDVRQRLRNYTVMQLSLMVPWVAQKITLGGNPMTSVPKYVLEIDRVFYDVKRVKFHSPFDIQREWLNVDPTCAAGQPTHAIQLDNEKDGFVLSDDFAARLEEAMDEVGSTSFYVGGNEKGVAVRVLPDVVMGIPERTDIALPNARQTPIRSVGESEVYYPVDLLDNDSLRAAIGAVPQEEQEKPMEVKDGLAGGPESLVTLAQVWQRDCLARGTPVRTGHLRLKELLIEAIEKEDNRALQALQTAGFEWGYDKSKELASLSFTGGTIVVQRGVTEEAEPGVKPGMILLAMVGTGASFRWHTCTEDQQRPLALVDDEAINNLRIELTIDEVKGYLVVLPDGRGRSTFCHENAMFPDYHMDLDSFEIPEDILKRLVDSAAVVYVE